MFMNIRHVPKSTIFMNCLSLSYVFAAISISFCIGFSALATLSLVISLIGGVILGFLAGFVLSAYIGASVQDVFTDYLSSPEAQERFQRECKRNGSTIAFLAWWGVVFLVFLSVAGGGAVPTSVLYVIVVACSAIFLAVSFMPHAFNLHSFKKEEQERVAGEEQEAAQRAAQLEQAARPNREFRRGVVSAASADQTQLDSAAEGMRMQALKAEGLFAIDLLPPGIAREIGSFVGAVPPTQDQIAGAHAGHFKARQEEQVQRAAHVSEKAQRAESERAAERNTLQEAIAAREVQELKDLQEHQKKEGSAKLAAFQEETYRQMPEALRQLRMQDLEEGTSVLLQSPEYQDYMRQRGELKHQLLEQKKESATQALQALQEEQALKREQALAVMDVCHAGEKTKWDAQVKREYGQVRQWEASLLWKEQQTQLKEIYALRKKEEAAPLMSSQPLEAAAVNDGEQEEEKHASDPASWEGDASKQPLLSSAYR